MSPYVSHWSRDREDLIDLTIDEDDDGYQVPEVIFIDDDQDEEIEVRILGTSLLERLSVNQRSGSLHDAIHEVQSTRTSTGFKIRVEDDVEVYDSSYASDADTAFLRVVRILYNVNTGKTLLRGIFMRRTRQMHDRLPRTRNEVCVVLANVHPRNFHPSLHESLVDVPLEQVLTKRSIIFTNCLPGNYRHSDLSYRDDRDTMDSKYVTMRGGRLYYDWKNIEESAVLVCRWKYAEHRDEKGNKERLVTIARLLERESDPGKGVSDAALAHWWLHVHSRDNRDPPPFPETVLANSEDAHRQASPDDDVVMAADLRGSVEVVRAVRLKKYTYGDTFSGAGGSLRGAELAGLQCVFGIDHWDVAAKTLRRNFQQTKIYHQDIHGFCTNNEGSQLLVDILHMSPPCQPYSGAHVIDGKQDPANSAATYSAVELLKNCRPRVATVENTDHIMFFEKNRQPFNALILQFTSMNYSVRFKSMQSAEYAAPQFRKRMIMLASCPGEPLPQYPAPTHGPGLIPYQTINNALSKYPRNVERHMRAYTAPVTGQRYSGDQPLRGVMTCGRDGFDVHPRENRSFNMQERALLMSFPPDHLFADTYKTHLRRLTGNAWPPVVARAVFEEIIRSLRKTDAERAGWSPAPEERITIDLT